jgi:hypothetical protein
MPKSMQQAVKHGARTTKPILSVSKTSTATGAMNALRTRQRYFEGGTSLPGNTEASPTATKPCRLRLSYQVCG